MIVNKSTQEILRILLVEKNHKLTLQEIAEKTNISLGMAVCIGVLKSADQLQKSYSYLQRYIAEQVLGDSLKTNLVTNALRGLQ